MLNFCETEWPEDDCLMVETCSLVRIKIYDPRLIQSCGDENG
jgi:hypothetical protein